MEVEADAWDRGALAGAAEPPGVWTCVSTKRIADEMFSATGQAAFAARAARELVATGERARRRTVDTREDLTAQGAQRSRLARDGPRAGCKAAPSPGPEALVDGGMHAVSLGWRCVGPSGWQQPRPALRRQASR